VRLGGLDLPSGGYRIPPEVAGAWKQRLRTYTAADGTTRERKHYLFILGQVRSFYLDFQEWAMEGHLQRLADSAAAHRTAMSGLLQAASAARVGEEFTHEGTVYRRTLRKSYLRDPMTTTTLATAHTECAAGICPMEAGVALLVDHGTFPPPRRLHQALHQARR
jgi:hypothetical protein